MCVVRSEVKDDLTWPCFCSSCHNCWVSSELCVSSSEKVLVGFVAISSKAVSRLWTCIKPPTLCVVVSNAVIFWTQIAEPLSVVPHFEHFVVSPSFKLWAHPHLNLHQGRQTLLLESHISYCTINSSRGRRLVWNAIVLGYVTFYQINKYFENALMY